MNTKLLLTFSSLENLDTSLHKILKFNLVPNSKVFALKIENEDKYALTYNISGLDNNFLPLNTMVMHRKKETNTLYTINALNYIVGLNNGGVRDKNFKVPWGEYRNSILTVNKGEYCKLKTTLYNIYTYVG